MALKVFINGMGRIGRLLVRKLIDSGIDVVGINDEYMTESKLVYLLKHDTVYDDWNATIDGTDNDGYIHIFGKKVNFYTRPDLYNLPLGEIDRPIVLECTGLFSSKSDAVLTYFMDAGASGCLFCYPINSSIDYVYNVNAFSGQNISSQSTPTSAGSASMNAAALLLKAINTSLVIDTVFIEEVRSYTGDQNLCDNVAGDKFVERGRAATQNIVPTTNQDIKSVGNLIPELNGKVLSTALRTPTIVGGAINATILFSKAYTVDEINTIVENAVLAMNESLAYSEERLVSSDVVSDDSKPIFLSTQTKVLGNLCNVTLLYDNEMGFVNQIVKLLTSCSF